MVVAGQIHAPAALTPGKRHGTHRTEGLVGPKASTDEWCKCHLHRESVSRPSRPKPIAISATLHWFTGNNIRVPERKGGKPFPRFYKINLLLTGDVKDKQELIPSDRLKRERASHVRPTDRNDMKSDASQTTITQLHRVGLERWRHDGVLALLMVWPAALAST